MMPFSQLHPTPPGQVPGGLGFEPRQKAPEAFVLPLHHPPMERSREGGIIPVSTGKLQEVFFLVFGLK